MSTRGVRSFPPFVVRPASGLTLQPQAEIPRYVTQEASSPFRSLGCAGMWAGLPRLPGVSSHNSAVPALPLSAFLHLIYMFLSFS